MVGPVALALPCPPVIDIESVSYLDAAGIEQLVDPSTYELRGDAIGTAWGKSWPTPSCHAEAVRVRYRAGYVTDASADPLVAVPPPAIRAAILLMVGDLYRNRENGQVTMPTVAGALLRPFRVWR